MGNIDFNDYFYYDETSPSCLRWKVDRMAGRPRTVKVASAGEACIRMDGKGYYQVRVLGKATGSHRVVWSLHHGVIPEGLHVDHIDRCTTNNKLENLRLVSPSQNMQNMSFKRNNVSGVTGVAFYDNGAGCVVARASWTEGRRTRVKGFAVRKFGLLPAWAMAIAYREAVISRLNSQGADYTATHGIAK